MREREDGDRTGVRRRNVLKGISVAGFVGSVPSITAAESQTRTDVAQLDSETKQDLRQSVEEYNSVEKVREAFAETGAPLLRTLEREGFIDDPAISSLPITETITPGQHTIGEEDGVMVVGVATPEGPTVRLQVVKKNETYTSVITVDVHTEDAYAVVRNREDPSEGQQVVSSDGARDVKPMCTTGAYCKRVIEPNSVPCYTVEVECCLSQEYCRDLSELGAECRSGACYDHCLFACGICEDGSC